MNQLAQTLTSIPPLESGDGLSRPEFERRYSASLLKKAELIEGIVYVASPLRHRQHGRPHSRIMTWLGIYQSQTPGIDVSDTPTVRLDWENEPQPDAVLFREVAGQTQIDSEGYLMGAPELIVELAASSAAIDLGTKKQVYRRNGVQEYIIWQSYENQLLWFVLEAGDYIQLQPDDAGILRSRVFPGLWLAVDALLKDTMSEVLRVVYLGLATEEHQNFVEQLQLGTEGRGVS